MSAKIGDAIARGDGKAGRAYLALSAAAVDDDRVLVDLCRVIFEPFDRRRGSDGGEGFSYELRPREFALLQTLLAAPTKIFTRQMLMDELWGYDSESDPRTVDTHIRRLREKLAGVPDFEIQTVRGLGYRAVIR